MLIDVKLAVFWHVNIRHMYSRCQVYNSCLPMSTAVSSFKYKFMLFSEYSSNVPENRIACRVSNRNWNFNYSRYILTFKNQYRKLDLIHINFIWDKLDYNWSINCREIVFISLKVELDTKEASLLFGSLHFNYLSNNLSPKK